MSDYCRRLIEVDLPIKRISAHARREKNIRQGHIATLHIWWARRPLAACRAVLCAALWLDPVDDACPAVFRSVAKSQMLNWTTNHLRLAGVESAKRFVAIQKNPSLLNKAPALRGALLDFIADFANWDNSGVHEYVETARALTKAAHEALGGRPNSRPLVVDSFAGGGAIPLESLRVGADAFASDLNPVAVLLNKVVLEYMPHFGPLLGAEVRKWGDWVGRRAKDELVSLYPKDNGGAIPIAYLWARTILSEAPERETIPVEVPLMRSLWLVKQKGRHRALRWKRDASGRVKTLTLVVNYADGSSHKVRRPILEIFEPKKPTDVEPGTVAGGSATCPVTGYTTSSVRVRAQVTKRDGGAADSRLIAVRQDEPSTGRRTWRLPTADDEAAADLAAQRLERQERAHSGTLSLVPDEPTPPGGGRGAGRAFSQRSMGMNRFRDLFTPRQGLALATLARLTREAGDLARAELDKDLADAVQVCLAQAVDRLADFNSSLCVLNSVGGRGVVHTFGRQVLPIVWDFMETNPFNDVGANWATGIDALVAVVESERLGGAQGRVEMADAAASPLPDDCAQVFFTDPPYYDAVPYADLSDFFFVWLRRSLGNCLPELFGQALSPKDAECIVDEVKGKDHAYFEKTMTRALSEGRRVLEPQGIGTVVFAHKSTSGWEAMLEALVQAGWVVTGSWPIDTERAGRLRAQSSAALASSIHIVCRPREKPDGSVQSEEVGDWREVLAELPRRIHDWMPRLAEEGVVGADAIFACLGPALEVFSRHSRVEKASGETVALREYLVEVWAAVSREALSMVFEGADASGFDEDARLTAMWLWTLQTDVATQEEDVRDEGDEAGEGKDRALPGYTLEYDAARKIAQGLGANLENLAHLVAVSGETATLLSAGARTKYLFGKEGATATRGRQKKKTQIALDLGEGLDALEEPSSGATGELPGRPGATVLDRLHQAMILFGAGRGEAVRRFLVEEGVGRNPMFWRLAQALSALYPAGSDEKRWVEGILARKKGLGL